MESGGGARVKTGSLSARAANARVEPSFLSRVRPPSLAGFGSREQACASARRRTATEGRTTTGGCPYMDSWTAEKMKIILFSIKLYKFTGFLDKFLKTDRADWKVKSLFFQ